MNIEKKFPRISIIINSHNGAKYLREAVDSVYSQTFGDWEIILYDNCSTDETGTIIKQYDERLRYFGSEKFLCLGEARNQALKYAKGEIIGFLDSDDIWLPEKLERQVPLFQDPEIGIVYSNAIYFVEGAKYSYPLYKKYNPPRGHIFRELLRSNHLTLGTVLIRRKCLDPIEWFPEDMNHGEEYDLFLRISYSWNADYIVEPLVMYRIHSQAWSVARPDSKPEEMKRILSRLYVFLPDLEKKYGAEVLEFKKTTEIIEANVLWNGNKRTEARKIFLNLFKMDKKLRSLIFFFLTFICSFEKYNITKHRLKHLKEMVPSMSK